MDAINGFLNSQNVFGDIFVGGQGTYFVPYAVEFDVVSAVIGSSRPWTRDVATAPTEGSFEYIYAVFNPAQASTPIPIPTPALLPGLLGLGAGVWRKQQQANRQVG